MHFHHYLFFLNIVSLILVFRHALKSLEFERIYFDFQKQEYQLEEEFLSGDIREKMDQNAISNSINRK